MRRSEARLVSRAHRTALPSSPKMLLRPGYCPRSFSFFFYDYYYWLLICKAAIVKYDSRKRESQVIAKSKFGSYGGILRKWRQKDCFCMIYSTTVYNKVKKQNLTYKRERNLLNWTRFPLRTYLILKFFFKHSW